MDICTLFQLVREKYSELLLNALSPQVDMTRVIEWIEVNRYQTHRITNHELISTAKC
jgi:hypothetical protein